MYITVLWEHDELQKQKSHDGKRARKFAAIYPPIFLTGEFYCLLYKNAVKSLS